MRILSPGWTVVFAGDPLAVDDDPVAALQVLDRHPVAGHDEHRVPARDERVVERELAAGAPTHDELPIAQREVVVLVAQAEAHGSLGLSLR